MYFDIYSSICLAPYISAVFFCCSCCFVLVCVGLYCCDGLIDWLRLSTTKGVVSCVIPIATTRTYVLLVIFSAILTHDLLWLDLSQRFRLTKGITHCFCDWYLFLCFFDCDSFDVFLYTSCSDCDLHVLFCDCDFITTVAAILTYYCYVHCACDLPV